MTTVRSLMLPEVLKEYQKPEVKKWISSLETLQEILAEFEYESTALKTTAEEEDYGDFAQQMLKFMGMWAGAAKRELINTGIAKSDGDDLVVLDLESGFGVMSCRFQLIYELIQLDKEYGFVENPHRFLAEEYKQVLSKFRSRYADFIAKFMDQEFNRYIVHSPEGFQPALDRILGNVIFEGLARYIAGEEIQTAKIAAFSHYSAKLIEYWGAEEPFRDAARGRGQYE